MDDSISEQIRTLTERIRQWYEQSPRAQHAYERLSADVDALGARVDALVNESEALRALRDRIAAAIDPSSAAPASQGPEVRAPQDTVGGAADAPSQTSPRRAGQRLIAEDPSHQRL